MKKFLTVIFVSIMIMNLFQQLSVDSSQLDQLIAQGKVPQYVKTTGKFYFNPNFEEHDGFFPTGIVAPTTNVNLRAEPNANAEKLGVLSPQILASGLHISENGQLLKVKDGFLESSQ